MITTKEMKIDFNMSKEDIERAVSNAIVESAIGDQIKKAVEDLLKKTYNNPIEEAIKKVILDIAMTTVTTKYKEEIEEAVKDKICEDGLRNFVDGLFGMVLSNKQNY